MSFDQRLIDYSEQYIGVSHEDLSYVVSPEARAFGERMKRERITNDEQHNEG